MLGKKRLILIAEDDADLRETLQRALSALDFQVALAPGGAEALRQIEANPPAIIITDIYMPDTDGFELINEVRKRGLLIPVIAISGRQFTGYAPLLSARRLGVDAILEKPFRPAALVVAVCRALGERPEPRGAELPLDDNSR